MTSSAPSDTADSPPITIKKYANRRLYDTQTSSYITLDTLAMMTRNGRNFKVIDAKTDEDITHTVLTQIIMEEEARGTTMLPANFLKQLIAMYGDSMQAMVPQYLEASMEAFKSHQAQFRTALEGALTGGPMADIMRRNMEMFGMTPPGAAMPDIASKPSGGKAAEVADLKAQMAALQAKIDKM